MSERAPLDEATLRETKDDLVSRIVEQAKLTPDLLKTGLGIDPTSIVAVEDYVCRTIRKSEVRHVELQREDRAKTIRCRDPLRGTPRHEGNRLVCGEAEVPRVVTMGPNMRAARQCFAEMKQLALQHGDATWFRQLDAIKAENLPKAFQDKQLKALLFKYVQKYGDPRIKKERPVSLPPPPPPGSNPWRRTGKRPDWETFSPRIAAKLNGRR